MGGEGQLIEIYTETGAEISLLIEINRQRSVTGLSEADSKIQCNGGFAASALGIGESKDVRHGFTSRMRLSRRK